MKQIVILDYIPLELKYPIFLFFYFYIELFVVETNGGKGIWASFSGITRKESFRR